MHIHAYWAYWCMCKQGHAACACVKRTCCMYKYEFIYMQTRGCCVLLCKRVHMVLHVLDHTEMHICTRPVTFSSVYTACCVCIYNRLLQVGVLTEPACRLYMSKVGVCKTLCPQHMLAPNYGQNCNVPKFHKFLWNLLKKQSGNLFIIPYQLTKFQASSSNSFRYILLTSLKCTFQRAIAPEKIDGICSKANQAIYSSFPIS